MAINIGPKIGIDGEAQFRKELNNIIQQSKTLEAEMKAVSSSFDDSTDSQEKLEAQTKILNQQIQVQEQRVEMLQKGVEDAAKEFGVGATETLKWEQALNEAKSTLNGMESKLSGLENGVEDVTKELEEGEQASFGFGDALKAGLLSNAVIEGVKSLAGNISDLTESTKEYRKIMASLEVSSERAGYSAEETSETYKTLYSVLGDDQTAATTTANLQAIGLEQNKLIELTNAAIGAWATYGDSIPIDGLAESINETIQAGTVTGNFADVLNWASLEGETFGVTLKENTEANEDWNKAVQEAETAEDYFNLALQDANTSTERANLVLKLLADQGLPEAGKAWQENNDDITDANKATSDFQDITADLAKKFSPVSTTLQKGFNRIAKSASDMVSDSDIDDFTVMIEDAADFIADDVMPAIKGLFDFIIDNKSAVLSSISGIGAGFVAWKAVDNVQNVTKSIKTMTAGIEGANGAMKLLNAAWTKSPAGVVAVAVGGLVTALGLLSTAVNTQTEEEKLLQEQFEKREKVLDELTESYNNTREAAYNSAGAEAEQLDSVKLLYDELTTLADKTGKVTDKDRDRANFILNELNKALGTEYELTGNQIEQYQTMQKEIGNLIQAKKAEALLGAQEKIYTEAIEKRQEAEKNYIEAYQAWSDQKEKIDKEYGDFKATYTQDQIDWLYQNGVVDAILYKQEMDNLDEKRKQYQEYDAQMQQYNDDIQLYDQATEEMFRGNTEKVIALFENRNSALTTASDVAGKTAEEQTRILQEQYSKALEDLEEYEKGYKAGLDGYSETGLESLRRFAENAKKEMEKAGVNVGEGFASGIESVVGQVKDAASAMAQAASGVVKKTLQIQSPSKVMKRLGEFTGEGFEIGVTESMKSAVAEIRHSLDDGLSSLSGIAPFSVPVGFGNPIFSSSNGRSVTYGDFSVVVNSAPGMDENALADAVAYKLQTQVMQKEAVFR